VTEWTSKQLRTDETVSRLAEAFTGESWSHSMGMFGLGDRVSTHNIRASIDGLDRIIDVVEFRRRLEEIEKGSTLPEDRKRCVHTFLDAWRARESSNDR